MVAQDVVVEFYLALAVLSDCPAEQNPWGERIALRVGDTSVVARAHGGLAPRIANEARTAYRQQDVGSETVGEHEGASRIVVFRPCIFRDNVVLVTEVSPRLQFAPLLAHKQQAPEIFLRSCARIVAHMVGHVHQDRTSQYAPQQVAFQLQRAEASLVLIRRQQHSIVRRQAHRLDEVARYTHHGL